MCACYIVNAVAFFYAFFLSSFSFFSRVANLLTQVFFYVSGMGEREGLQKEPWLARLPCNSAGCEYWFSGFVLGCVGLDKLRTIFKLIIEKYLCIWVLEASVSLCTRLGWLRWIKNNIQIDYRKKIYIYIKKNIQTDFRKEKNIKGLRSICASLYSAVLF